MNSSKQKIVRQFIIFFCCNVLLMFLRSFSNEDHYTWLDFFDDLGLTMLFSIIGAVIMTFSFNSHPEE